MSDFDWVNARAECSLVAAFIRLEKSIKDDTAAANQRFKDRRKFGVTIQDSNSFSVYEEVQPPRHITFKLSESQISVVKRCDGREDIQFSATLTINKDKQCRFLVEGEELEEWQFRKKALEPLFFSCNGINL
jgi:hypothetical protein